LIGRRPDLDLKKNHRSGSGLSKYGMAWPIPNPNKRDNGGKRPKNGAKFMESDFFIRLVTQRNLCPAFDFNAKGVIFGALFCPFLFLKKITLLHNKI
jgi:hypothetical protein